MTPAQYAALTPNAREAVDLDRDYLPRIRAWRDGLRIEGNVLSFAAGASKPKPSARRAWLSRALAIACGNRLNAPGCDDGPGGGGPTGGTPAASAGGAVLAA